MSGGIDELSMMLGAMQSDIKEGIRQRRGLDSKMDQILEILPIVAEMRKEMDETVLPAVKEWIASRHRHTGIAIGAGAGAGISGAGLWPVLKSAVLKIIS